MSRLNNRKTFIALAVLILILLLNILVYGIRALQDWVEYDLDFPAQDCLMSTWTIQGTVTDEQNNPIANAQIEINGHHLICENGVRFPIGSTNTTGTFDISKAIYSPIVNDGQGPTIEPTQRAQLLKLNGVYEVTISADGYIPYYKADMTDDEVFGGLRIVLKKR